MKKIRFFNNKIKAKIENNNNHKFSIVTEQEKKFNNT